MPTSSCGLASLPTTPPQASCTGTASLSGMLKLMQAGWPACLALSVEFLQLGLMPSQQPSAMKTPQVSSSCHHQQQYGRLHDQNSCCCCCCCPSSHGSSGAATEAVKLKISPQQLCSPSHLLTVAWPLLSATCCYLPDVALNNFITLTRLFFLTLPLPAAA